ncbi:MAG: hypothetical protein HRU70_14560 [Phycisphaeraceae bacterium]|nr:MAG: hypothetical protein HRU70_14560 [Phycisphaeraceae bacterium]
MRKSAMLAGVAGLALVASAMANDVAVPVTGPVQRVPVENMGGVRIAPTSRDNTVFYDQTIGGLLTNTANPRVALDDASAIPGPASNATFPLVVNAFNTGFAMPVATDFDLEVTFFDGIDLAAPADTLAATGFIAGYVIEIRGLAAGTYETGLIDLSGGFEFTLPDAGFFVLVRYMLPGYASDLDMVPLGSVHVLHGGGRDAGTWASNQVGHSHATYIRDFDADGIAEIADGFRAFGFPNSCNIYFQLQADIPACSGGSCPADFNGDGFLDFFDLDAYIEAFETGC